MKSVSKLFALLVLVLPGEAFADPGHFDYENTQSLYVIDGDKAHAYATFPAFVKFRGLIAQRMADASANGPERSETLYTVRVVGIGEQTTLYIGKDWISDGTRSATLNEDESRWVEWAVGVRRSEQGIDPDRLDRYVQLELAGQHDPSWRPAP